MRRLFFLALLFFLPRTNMHACDCNLSPLSMENIKPAEFIFLGEVVAISGCDKTAKATFSIKELYRGKSFPNTALEFDCSSDCQMSFAPGQTWLIYATYKKYGEAEVSFCSYSRQQFSADKEDFNTIAHGMNFAEEQAWLKKNLGVQEFNQRDVTTEQHHENILPKGYDILWFVGGGLVVVIAFYFLGRKFLK